MKKLLLIAFGLFCSFSIELSAQTRVPSSATAIDSTSRMRVYTVNGQKVGVVQMDSVKIKRKKVGKGKARRAAKRLKRYTQVRWHVHKVFPYAVKLGSLLNDINFELATLPDTVKRRHYLKSKKKELFNEYEDKLRKMSKNQGRILVKLIYRETGQTLYHLIKDVKSGVTASFWQSIGTVYGININKKYDPDEPENWMIEKCVKELEAGGYNMVYKQYNFRL
jgi:hypothetical protein